MAANPLSKFLSAEAGAVPEGRSQIDAILDAVRQHLGMEIAFTSRYDGDHREFTHIKADIPVPAAPGDREPADQSYCWHVLNGRLPELIRDSADIPFTSTLSITGTLPVGAHISVPLRRKDGSVYGSFCCLSRSSDHSLTGRDLAAVHAFAELAMQQIELEHAEEAKRLFATARIEKAIAAGQPLIHLQPIHRLDTGRSTGAEALARFPDFQDRPPNKWFEEAHSVGLGVELEFVAVRQALAALPYVPTDKYLSVNVSPSTVISGCLAPLVESIGDRDVVFEITEHSRVEDFVGFHKALATLRPHVRIAIDDVGAGYAGLQHILQFQPDILKLDMGLTRGIHMDAAKRALTQAMVSFADRVGSIIVAEGVECAEERRVLIELGVVYGQGWLFSKAMPIVTAQQCLIGATDGEPTAKERVPSPVRAAAAAHR